MKFTRNIVKGIALGAAALLAVGALVGCSGSGSGDQGGDGGGTDDGITVGISVAAGQNSTLQAIVEGLRAELETVGGELITADAKLDIDKQIADIDTFVNQGVDAIVVIPIDFPTLGNALQRADAAGIPLFANDAVVGDDVTAEQLAPFQAQVRTKRPADSVADFIEERTGGEGQVAAITIAAPVAQIEFFVDEFQADIESRSGLEFVGAKGNPSDDAAGARPIADAFLTQYPDLRAIFSYNDPSAVGASAAATAAGKRDQVVITGFNASQDGLDAVKDGTIDATWDYRAPDQGQLLGRLVIATVLDGKTTGHQYEVESQIVTAENIDDFVPWEERIELIRKGEYAGISID
ncbi:MAG: hypothetical protein D3X82_02165 [Candidatus Leucobacter sulfamidivorax]|nr:hypothetical protein [Candidatus Leucobacter sulfamidivorax]